MTTSLTTSVTAAATAAPAAEAAPAVTATATAAAVPPVASASAGAGPAFDTAAAKAALRRAASGHDWPHATEAFLALADHDATAFHDPALLAPTRDMAAAAAIAGGDGAERVFDALGRALGADGADVLYEIVRTRGGSKAAARADELLRRGDVMARATPALRITFALREAPCPEKAALLDRAVADGDARTLVVMQTVGAACLGRNPALGEAVKGLKARLRGK